MGHAYGTPLHQAANLHILGAINNGDLFEMRVPEGILNTPMQETIPLDKDGWVNFPQKPGLGLEIDWGGIKKRTTAILK